MIVIPEDRVAGCPEPHADKIPDESAAAALRDDNAS